MKFAVVPALALLLGGCLASSRQSAPGLGVAHVTVTDEVLVRDAMRFGVNLGTWTSWGAEQLASNVVMNPGFEGQLDRAIVIVGQAGLGRFTDDQAALARPDGFWEHARFDVRTGYSAGQSGEILQSRASGPGGLPSFLTRAGSPEVEPGDVVTLTKISESERPSQWWFAEGNGALYTPAVGETRPGSGGARSLRVSVAPSGRAEVVSYFDAIGDRAGKLLPLTGTWRLSFWSRLDEGRAKIRVTLQREGSVPVVRQELVPGREWQKTEVEFAASDTGPAGKAALRFEVTGAPSGEILLDDVDLRRASDSRSAFRGEVVSALKALRPGWLRDWEGQLGDTFENRTAPAEGRRTSRYRPGGTEQTGFSYGLGEFLDLALEVDASPWIVVPTTFTDEECGRLGAYLNGNPRYVRFREIVVEFGNENWNTLFRPAGIPHPGTHGEAADRCFANLRRTAGGRPLRTLINAQHANPTAVAAFASASGSADLVGVAPYFLNGLDAGLAPAAGRVKLFEGDSGHLAQIASIAQKQHRELAVYEVNLHTDAGSAPDYERRLVTSGVASATALAKTMLDALALGTRRQCVYTLAGFDNSRQDHKDFVRLWGIARDLASGVHFRPTGLGLKLMNEALGGEMVRTAVDDKAINAYAFHEGKRWATVLASTSATARKVQVEIPVGATAPTVLIRLQGDAEGATNEDGEHVTIQTEAIRFQGQMAVVTMRPFELLLLRNEEEGK